VLQQMANDPEMSLKSDMKVKQEAQLFLR